MRPGHADIGDIGRAAGQNVFIRGRYMRVSADDDGHPPVQIPAHGDFLAGRFGMHVHQDEGDIGRQFSEFCVSLLERIIDGGQEDASLQIQNRIFGSVLRRANI